MTAALGYGLYLLPGVAQLAWVARLGGLRLLSRYPSLALYLLFATLSSWVVLTAHHLYHFDSEAYLWFFVVTQRVGWTLLLCVVLEIYQRMIAGYEGLGRLGRLVMYGAVGALAVVLTFLLLLDKPDGALGQWRNFWFRQERSVYLGLCVLSVVLAGFGAYFHLHAGKNVVVVFGAFGALFAGQAFVLTLVEQFDGMVGWKDTALPLWHGTCLLWGAAAFSRRGEDLPVKEPLGLAAGAGAEPVLVRRLEGLNRTLLRMLKP